jgi:hypothetical protein
MILAEKLRMLTFWWSGEQEAPASILKEERENENDKPNNYVRYGILHEKKFELESLRTKMTFGIQQYSTLLAKFENDVSFHFFCALAFTLTQALHCYPCRTHSSPRKKRNL